ncbi:MAG TPA: ATP-binding protein [Gemmataceae bacterium]|nr:ATP-binding protein [Gemmataceae bacterium]
MSDTAKRAEVVLRLAWLSPSAASLALLGRQPAATTWPAIRRDPGAVLLVVRHSEIPWPGRSSSAPPPSFHSVAFEQAALIEDALHLLDQPDGFVDWNHSAVQSVYDACLTFARVARRLAERTGQCDPEAAWTCGLLAPLGWLAMCAVDPEAVAACLADPALRVDPAETQRRHWGIDQAAIARRLARRWHLPAWATAAAEHLHLPSALAQTFRADPVLFPLTRLAIDEARKQGVDLGLGNGAFNAEDRSALLISAGQDLDAGRLETHSLPVWQEPRHVPLLRDLLELAAENRRLREQPLHDHLEQEIDALHRALEEQVHGEAQRLQSGKLAALAEFSAGAGHEINNPLAVISGQAQYLLSHESDWFHDEAEDAPRKALEAIVTQTRRVHGILRELMQFAKPAPSCPGWVDLPALLGETAAGLGELAAQRRVRLEVALQPERLPVYADAAQLRIALSCLLRNAIEAAPADGWARLVLRQPTGDESIEVAIEDNGPGPEAAQRPHLFDPFYSGRTAGRGRGMGLPIAWRLAHLQGGDVRLDPPRRHEPTRFVLSLPHLVLPESDGSDPALLSLSCLTNGRHAS